MRRKCICTSEDAWLETGGINGHTFACFRYQRASRLKGYVHRFMLWLIPTWGCGLGPKCPWCK